MKSKILVMLACMGLLVTACGGNPSEPSQSGSQSSGDSSGQEESDEKYYSLPFNAENPTADPVKWEKGATYSWTFDVKEDHVAMTFAFGAKMSDASHDNHSLFLDSATAGTDAYEQDATHNGEQRITVKVNGANQCLTRQTYGEAGLSASDIAYYKVATFGIKQGKVDVSITTHADAGYRLFLGGEARLYYPKVEPATVEGYNVAFAGEHCKVYVYPSKNYEGVEPTLATSTKTVLDSGVQSKYYTPTKNDDGTYEDDEVKPQVNFKVVCDEGYKLDDNSIAISGAKGNEWNDIKPQGNGIYRITKIKADINVTITPVVDDGGETIDAAEITFTLTNCTVKVYIGAKDETGSNVDAGPKFYSRDKTDPTQYNKGDNAQFNFEVVPNAGFKFEDGVTFDDSGEAKASAVSFIAATGDASYNKLKKVDTNLYKLTKVAGDLVITLNCVAA